MKINNLEHFSTEEIRLCFKGGDYINLPSPAKEFILKGETSTIQDNKYYRVCRLLETIIVRRFLGGKINYG